MNITANSQVNITTNAATKTTSTKPDYPLAQIKYYLDNFNEIMQRELPAVSHSEFEASRKSGTSRTQLATDAKVDIENAMRDSLTPRELIILHCIHEIYMEPTEWAYVLNMPQSEMLAIEHYAIKKIYQYLNNGVKRAKKGGKK